VGWHLEASWAQVPKVKLLMSLSWARRLAVYKALWLALTLSKQVLDGPQEGREEMIPTKMSQWYQIQTPVTLSKVRKIQ